MHIGHNYRFLYTIQQNNTTYKLSYTTEERDLDIWSLIISVGRLSVHRQQKAVKYEYEYIHRQFRDVDKANTWTRTTVSCW